MALAVRQHGALSHSRFAERAAWLARVTDGDSRRDLTDAIGTLVGLQAMEIAVTKVLQAMGKATLHEHDDSGTTLRDLPWPIPGRVGGPQLEASEGPVESASGDNEG